MTRYERALDSAVQNAMDTAHERGQDETWADYLRANLWEQIDTHGLHADAFLAYAEKHAGCTF